MRHPYSDAISKHDFQCLNLNLHALNDHKPQGDKSDSLSSEAREEVFAVADSSTAFSPRVRLSDLYSKRISSGEFFHSSFHNFSLCTLLKSMSVIAPPTFISNLIRLHSNSTNKIFPTSIHSITF